MHSNSQTASEVILLSKYLLYRSPIANSKIRFIVVIFTWKSTVQLSQPCMKSGSTLLPVLDHYLWSKCKKKLMVSLGNGRKNCLLHYYNTFLFLSRFYIWDQLHQMMTHCTTEWHNAQGRDDSSNNYKLFIADSRGIQIFLETLLLESEATFQEGDIDMHHVLIQPLRL